MWIKKVGFFPKPSFSPFKHYKLVHAPSDTGTAFDLRRRPKYILMFNFTNNIMVTPNFSLSTFLCSIPSSSLSDIGRAVYQCTIRSPSSFYFRSNLISDKDGDGQISFYLHFLCYFFFIMDIVSLSL